MASPPSDHDPTVPVALDRRRFVLGVAGAAALAGLAPACGGAEPSQGGPSPSDTGAPPDAALDAANETEPVVDAASDAPDAPDTTFPTPTCMETETNIEGPFYRSGAPFRGDLASSLTGVKLHLRGRVFGVGCAAPLLDAVVDLWQADDGGHYDNDGTIKVPPEEYRLRGKMKVDAAGKYEFRTIIPGHYLNGSQYRPAHLHVKVSAGGHRLLTTQLYFEGDPYNSIDPFIKKPLIMKLENGEGGVKLAWFDFVLAKA